MTSPSINRVFLFIAQTGGLPQKEQTLATGLRQHGYSTGLIGKWHLGNDAAVRGDREHHPNRHGFEYFYGIPFTNLKDFNGKFFSLTQSVISSQFPKWMTYSVASLVVSVSFCIYLYKMNKNALSLSNVIFMTAVLLIPTIFISSIILIQSFLPLVNSILMRNGEVIEQPFLSLDSTERFVKEANSFMSRAVESNQPFFCMINFVKVHSFHMPSSKFKGKSNHGPYGDVVMELDDGIGQVLQHLTKLGIRDNTLVYFTSDNGGHLEDVQEGQVSGGYNGLLRGGKGQGAMEGGIRVPTIISWPNILPKDTEVSVPVSLMDLFPTVLEAAGVSDFQPLIDNRLDGKSLMPLLTNKSTSGHHRFLFHYCGSYLHGVTYTQDKDHIWKVYFYTPNYKNDREDKCEYVCQCTGSHVIQHHPPRIFNLVDDLNERNDLKDSSTIDAQNKYQHVLKEVKKAVEEHNMSLTYKAAESQFSFWKSIWRPDLQPCCSWYNLCNCKERKSE
jgi:arylsulfatase A-like enzyme